MKQFHISIGVFSMICNVTDKGGACAAPLKTTTTTKYSFRTVFWLINIKKKFCGVFYTTIQCKNKMSVCGHLKCKQIAD